MADNAPRSERTEKPTQRRLKETREQGTVARSRDLSSAVSLAVVTITLGWLGASLLGGVTDRLIVGLRTMGDQPLRTIEPTSLATMAWADLWRVARLAGPLVLLAGCTSAGASIAQVGWVPATKAVQFNWNRLNPSQGFSRLQPMQAVPELVKALIGVLVMGSVCYVFVRGSFDRAPALVAMTPGAALQVGWQDVTRLLWRASLALLVLGGADYWLQHWRWLGQVKMTRREVRDDAKLAEGSPEIKARVRKVAREMTRRRMLKAVKQATVVITNPTHVAVALEYRRQDMVAPRVVAKGQDLMAARIRKVAREAGVPIVENVTLARALHKGADVGDTIPAALFGAVAEVLAYLVRLKQLVL